MKRFTLSTLVLLLSCSAAFSQRVMKVEKTDGTTIEYPVKEVVRVYFEGEEPAGLALSATTLSLQVDETSTVEIISGSGHYAVRSDKTSVATAELNKTTITIHAVAAGIATITVTDTQNGQRAKIEVTVSNTTLTCPDDHHPHLIDLGLPSGTKWACCNVDTDHPESQSPTNNGGYYAWGETERKNVYNWSTYIHCDGSFWECHDIGTDIAGTQYDVAHVKWGGTWKMPTLAQVEELLDNCPSTWIQNGGVYGRLFTGPNGSRIFLPAAGYRSDDGLYNVGDFGTYWSSTQKSSAQNPSLLRDAYHQGFYNLYAGLASWGNYHRCNGRSVRPVSR